MAMPVFRLTSLNVYWIKTVMNRKYYIEFFLNIQMGVRAKV